MKILFIWGESLGKPGGGTIHFRGLAEGLIACGHELKIIAPHYKGMDSYAGDLDIHFIRLPRRSFLSFLLFQILLVLRLAGWVRLNRPDAIYVRTCFFQGLMGLVSRLWSVPLIGEVDSMVDQEILMRGGSRIGAWLIRKLDYINNRLSSGLVCVTRGLKEECLRRGARADTTAAINNGARARVMCPQDRLEARREFNLPADKVIVGFAGTFAPWQGLDFLLDAAKELKQRANEDIHFALLGQGQLEQEIRRSLERDGLENRFTLIESGTHEKAAKFLSACDASVIPIHDTRKLRYGLSALKFWDAVSVGLPVFVPKGADLDDVLVDLGLPGLFDPARPASLVDELVSFSGKIEHQRSRRQEVHEMVCQHYSWDSVAKKVTDFIQIFLPPGCDPEADKPLKMLQIANQAGPLRLFILPVCKRLQEMGTQVELACMSFGPNYQPLLESGFTVHGITPGGWSNPLTWWRTYREVRKILKKGRYDLMVVHTPVMSWIARFASRNLVGSAIYMAHGLPFAPHQSKVKYNIFRFVEKRLAKFTDGIIVMNQADADACQRYGLTKAGGQWFKVPGVGVDVDKWAVGLQADERKQLNDEFGLSEDRPVLLYLGRFIPTKRPDDIIELAKRFGRRADFILAGEGPLWNSIKQKAQSVDSNIQVLGFTDRIHELVHRCDLVVFPSVFREGLPRFLLEAQAAGKPVVAYDVRGSRDAIKDKQTGFLVPAKDFDAFYEAVVKLIEDKDLCRQMGQVERNWIKQKFSLDAAIDAQLKVIQWALGEESNIT